MALLTLLEDLRGDPRFMATVAAWRTLPAQVARYAPAPPDLHPDLTAMLHQRGIDQLYTHQAAAVAHALAGASQICLMTTGALDALHSAAQRWLELPATVCRSVDVPLQPQAAAPLPAAR